MDVPAWKRGLQFLQIMKQNIPAAVHSIVVHISIIITSCLDLDFHLYWDVVIFEVCMLSFPDFGGNNLSIFRGGLDSILFIGNVNE